ncbi:hypothetical protein [Curtobacterium sp. MCSS17_016]|uniref:hypothetical protein n=1 Tax=Curtobacterium sp. MCSS17_016 TaxID=2175644 RepID=UPI0011B8491D|nr:hypothetical protein [Curtobacterium sp. MCSS17_016]WIE80947.1 hypothetical protein DEJ19_020740 [Curtobacterium sp. MCSS17_016]
MSEQTPTPVPPFQTRAEALGAERHGSPVVPAAVPVPPPAAPRPVPPPAAVPAAVPAPPAPASAVPVPAAVPARPAPAPVPPVAPAPAPAPVAAAPAAPAPAPASAPVVPSPSAPEPDEEQLSALDKAALSDEAYVVHDDPWADVTNAEDGSITLADPPAAADEDDDDDDETDTPKKTSPRRNAAKDRALVRKTVAKVLEVQAAEADLVNVAASILGVNPDNTADLTVAVITANSRDLQVVTDLKTILDADALEAGVTATGLGRARLRAVWKLLAGLGGVTGEMPSSDAKAAIALVKALHAGDSTAIRSRVDDAVDLLRK